MPINIGDVGDFITKYWMIFVAVVLLILALGETRWQVRQLILDRSHEEIQDARLDALAGPIVNHEARLDAVETHMTPSAIQKWGAVQQDVNRHEAEINSLEYQAHEH